MNRNPKILANSLLDAPDLSSVLYILYWNLPLNATALRDLGDLRLLVKKKEACINEKEKEDEDMCTDGHTRNLYNY